jgi:hypothetical protein
MERQRTPQQPLGGLGVIESQPVDGHPDQCLAVSFHPLGRPQFGPAPTACVSAMECGTAERTALHRSRLKVEKQVLQLAARVLQGSAVAAAPGIPDRLDQVDDLGAILLAGLVQLRARLRQ